MVDKSKHTNKHLFFSFWIVFAIFHITLFGFFDNFPIFDLFFLLASRSRHGTNAPSLPLELTGG